MTDKRRPKLRVVKGKTATASTAMQAKRLTQKQEKFLNLVLGYDCKPMTLTDAYRETYKSNMTDQNTRTEAYRLYKTFETDPLLIPHLNSKQAELSDRNRTRDRNLKDEILQGIYQEANDFQNGSPTSRVRSWELLGRTIPNLFNSNITIEESKSAEDIKEELEKKLKTLLSD